MAELCQRIKIPQLRHYGVQEQDIPALIEKAARASSMKGNPTAFEEGNCGKFSHPRYKPPPRTRA